MGDWPIRLHEAITLTSDKLKNQSPKPPMSNFKNEPTTKENSNKPKKFTAPEGLNQALWS